MASTNKERPVVVLATRKQRMRRMFQELMPEYQVLSLAEIGYAGDIITNDSSLTENAFKKAETAMYFLRKQNLDYTVVGECSELNIDEFGSASEALTAQCCDQELSNQGKRDWLRRELRLRGIKDPTARYSCVLAVYPPKRTGDGSFSCVGVTHGRIIDEERGTHGFAFDRVFWSKDLQKTFGEATEAERMSVSHHTRAIERMLERLR